MLIVHATYLLVKNTYFNGTLTVANLNIFFFRYQNDLPKKIKSRGKDAHLVHDELVQTIKWKLAVSKKKIA